MGEQVAQHVRPVKLDGGVLSVEVDDPAWATQVKFLAPTIITPPGGGRRGAGRAACRCGSIRATRAALASDGSGGDRRRRGAGQLLGVVDRLHAGRGVACGSLPVSAAGCSAGGSAGASAGSSSWSLPASLMASIVHLASGGPTTAVTARTQTPTMILTFLAFFFLTARASAARSEASLGLHLLGHQVRHRMTRFAARRHRRSSPSSSGAGGVGAGTGNVGSVGAEPSVRTWDTTGSVGPLSTLLNAEAGGTLGSIGAELVPSRGASPSSRSALVVSFSNCVTHGNCIGPLRSDLERARHDERMASEQATIKSRLQTDLTASMKARDELTTSTLRMLRAAITNAEVAGAEAIELTDDQAIAVLQSEAKKRAEAAEIYEQAGRAEIGRQGARRADGDRALPAGGDERRRAAGDRGRGGGGRGSRRRRGPAGDGAR